MKYRWQSQQTGEIVENFGEVLKTFFLDLKYYKFFNVRWKFNRDGF